jgi:hypothetical protein
MVGVRWVFVEEFARNQWRVYCSYTLDDNLGEHLNNIQHISGHMEVERLTNTDHTGTQVETTIPTSDGGRQKIYVFSLRSWSPEAKRRYKLRKLARKRAQDKKTSEFLQSLRQ